MFTIYPLLFGHTTCSTEDHGPYHFPFTLEIRVPSTRILERSHKSARTSDATLGTQTDPGL